MCNVHVKDSYMYKFIFAGGAITMDEFINSDNSIELQWEGFESNLEIMMYYVAIGNSSDALGHDCKQYVSCYRTYVIKVCL